MRMQLPGRRARARARAQSAEPPAQLGPWRARWLEAAVVIAAIAVTAVCLSGAWPAPLELAPLLAVPPALAGVGAATVKRPLAYGAAALIAAVIIDALVKGGITVTNGGPHQLALAAVGSVIVVTLLSMVGARVGAANKTTQQAQQAQQIVNVTSVAEAAQRAVLRQLPETVGPLSVGVVYLAAAAEARVGGDLYEVTATEHGVRLIIGDVRGKGLEAVEVAADIIGRFRELAHSVHTLDEIAYRLDAGLTRRWGQHEEFVTALLGQIDIERGRLAIFNCGHPPPILVSPSAGVSVLEVRAPAPPLGLLTLGNDSGAKEMYAFNPNDQLLLYTDGVTEARDASREFYPLDQRVAVLAPRAQPKPARSARAAARQLANHSTPSLLDLVRDDLIKYVGSPPHDDAAMLLIRAPASWPNARRAPAAAR